MDKWTSLHSSTHPSILHQSPYSSIHQSISPSIHFLFCASIHPSISPFIHHLSIHPFILPPFHVCTHPSLIHPSIPTSISPPISPFIHPSIYPSLYPLLLLLGYFRSWCLVINMNQSILNPVCPHFHSSFIEDSSELNHGRVVRVNHVIPAAAAAGAVDVLSPSSDFFL